MAKQTFTTGQVLTAAQMTSLQQTAMLGGDASAKVASYVLVAADAGTAISMSNGSATTITVNTGLFAAGDIVTIINLGAGVCTITAGTATVTTSGSLALAQNQGGVLRFTSASAAIFFQFATPASGDIEGVTAGTGISGGGTSGTVTITNSMATAIDAKGDLIVGTGADTFSRLAVGANATVLTADSAEATGLKWAAPGGGDFTKLASGTISGTSISFDNVFSSTYNNYYLFWNTTDTDGAQRIRLRVSGADNTTTNYAFVNQSVSFGGTPAFSNLSNSSSADHWLDLPVGSAGNRYCWQIGFTGFIDGSLIDQISYQGFFNRRASSSGVSFGSFAAGTAFDGFTVYNTGSTFSGTYALYAFKK